MKSSQKFGPIFNSENEGNTCPLKRNNCHSTFTNDVKKVNEIKKMLYKVRKRSTEGFNEIRLTSEDNKKLFGMDSKTLFANKLIAISKLMLNLKEVTVS